MSSFQLSRAKNPLLLLLALVGLLALVDSIVSGRMGWDSFGGVEQGQTFSRLELASAKSAALGQAERRGVRIGLVVGMSTADWGVDLRQLETPSDAVRWAKITGEFSSFSNLLDVVRRFDQADFTPERTLLCIHYGMLLGARRHKSTRSERLGEILARARQARSTNEIARLVTLSWAGNNRAGVANTLELRLGSWHERLLGWLGQPADVAYPTLLDPFEDTPNHHQPMHPSVRQRHVANFAERWRLAQIAPEPDQRTQALALGEIVARLGRRPGLKLVLMPEHSALRAVEPELFARRSLEDALATSGLQSSPPIIDLRSAVPDEYFADEAHATAAGRPLVTSALKRAQ